jgi:hypothetical protein
VWWFFGTTCIIEVDNFCKEFTMWCELQKSRNGNFNPYMVWKALYGCLEGAPLSHFGEFELGHSIEILAWRDSCAPTYTDVLKEAPRFATPIEKGKKEEIPSSMEGGETTTLLIGDPPPYVFFSSSIKITMVRGLIRVRQ